jgi:threonine aldolase
MKPKTRQRKLMDIIDLRSDTFTQPTDEMREAMKNATVGDDVFDEDPTINKLQDTAAEKLGKESSLFLPSGTMGNLVSVLTHCGRGDEIILGDRSHIFLNEAGGISALGGVHPRILKNKDDGTISLDKMELAVRLTNIHYPPTRLICLENTHNFCYGNPIGIDYMTEVASLGKKNNLKIHLDGARIFNAATALKVDVKKITQHVDTVMFSLSKGLSAPVGSIICGSKEFITKAKKNRKMLGGGMRQCGHLAAAGLIALEEQSKRLNEDHENAKKFSEAISKTSGIQIDLKQVRSNIVFFGMSSKKISGQVFVSKLGEHGVKILETQPDFFRAVFHRGVLKEQALAAAHAIQEILEY